MIHLDASPAMLSALESALPENHWLRDHIRWARASRVPADVVRVSLQRIAAFWSEHGLVTAETMTDAQLGELVRAGLFNAHEAMFAAARIGDARERFATAWNQRAVSK